jgi:hypothetical protein
MACGNLIFFHIVSPPECFASASNRKHGDKGYADYLYYSFCIGDVKAGRVIRAESENLSKLSLFLLVLFL